MKREIFFFVNYFWQIFFMFLFTLFWVQCQRWAIIKYICFIEKRKKCLKKREFLRKIQRNLTPYWGRWKVISKFVRKRKRILEMVCRQMRTNHTMNKSMRKKLNIKWFHILTDVPKELINILCSFLIILSLKWFLFISIKFKYYFLDGEPM